MLYEGEVVGVAVMLLISLFIAVKILIIEVKEEIADRQKRYHWKHYRRHK